MSGPVESFTSHGKYMPYPQSGTQREGIFKKPILSEGSVQSALSGIEGKAAVVLTRGAYASYVSANVAKSDKSVSPKTAKRRHRVWRAAPAWPGNDASGSSTRLRTSFFQHSPYLEHQP